MAGVFDASFRSLAHLCKAVGGAEKDGALVYVLNAMQRLATNELWTCANRPFVVQFGARLVASQQKSLKILGGTPAVPRIFVYKDALEAAEKSLDGEIV